MLINLEVHMHGRCLVVSCASGMQNPPTGQTSILTGAVQVEVAVGFGPGLSWNALGCPAMAAFTAAIDTVERGGGREGVKISRCPVR